MTTKYTGEWLRNAESGEYEERPVLINSDSEATLVCAPFIAVDSATPSVRMKLSGV